MATRILPLLVQSAVLFPGATLPIRLWQLNQRRLVKDAIAGDKLIGIVSLPDALGGTDAIPKTGYVGCMARLLSAKRIPNKQLRILVEGMERFAVQRVLEPQEPYPSAEVTPYEDFQESPKLLETFAHEVRRFYERYLAASGKIADMSGGSSAELPADPVELSLVLPTMMRLDEETCQRFLSSRSTLMRLRELSALLSPAATAAEISADVHARSRSNGHGASRG